MFLASKMIVRPALAAALLVALSGCGRNAVFGLGEPEDTGALADAGATGDGAVPDAEAIPDGAVPPALDAGTPAPEDGGAPLDGGEDLDGAAPIDDAGFDDDGGAADDSGVVIDVDAGPPPTDAGASTDAGTVTDAGTPAPDAGIPVPDAGTPACTSDADCGRGAPFCNPTSGQCVECLTDNQCSFGRTCDTAYGNVCRRDCTGRCRGGDVCDPASGLCYACLSDADCGSDELCHPTLRECVQCLGNSDCAAVPGRPICTPNLECAGCGSDADCPAGEQYFPEQGGYCAPPTGRALCAPCDDDAQCGGADDLCVGVFTGTSLADRSCASDCSNSPCPTGFECTTVRVNRRVCRPSYDMRTPTCTAVRNLGNTCLPDPNDLDPGCGVENVQDARCVAISSGGPAMCSVWCQDNADCPNGTTCTPAGNVSVCM